MESKMNEKEIRQYLLSRAPLEDFYILLSPSGNEKDALFGCFNREGDPFFIMEDDDKMADCIIKYLIDNRINVFENDDALSEYIERRYPKSDAP